jgi:NDP-mannose synthase
MAARATGPRQAVILAGGKGSRLAPFTTVLPKPLLPVGDRAILETVLLQLAASGVKRVTIAVGHLAHLIEAVLGDGRVHGLEIDYHREDEPLGTIGPLATMTDLDEHFIVMNGDVLTTLDYAELFRAHLTAGDALTIATHVRTLESDYGVLQLDGYTGATRRVAGFSEKPKLELAVSMGVYVLDRRVCRHIPVREAFDLPDLVGRLLLEGEQVGSYRYDGLWLDIGRRDDYEQATNAFDANRATLLPERPADPPQRIPRRRFARGPRDDRDVVAH